MEYHELAWAEVQVLKAVFQRHLHDAFAPIDVPGLSAELVLVVIDRLREKGLIDASADGTPGDVTAAGSEWMRAYGVTRP
jgi:hypothetical protein